MTPQQFRTHAHPTTPQPLRRTRSRRFTHLYGTENSEDVLEQLEALMTSHPHEDIRVKARMIRTVMEDTLKGQGQAEEEDEDDLR